MRLRPLEDVLAWSTLDQAVSVSTEDLHVPFREHTGFTNSVRLWFGNKWHDKTTWAKSPISLIVISVSVVAVGIMELMPCRVRNLSRVRILIEIGLMTAEAHACTGSQTIMHAYGCRKHDC